MRHAEHESVISNTQQSIRRLSTEDNGLTNYIGRLSYGCECCKTGKWICVFVTQQCNLNCEYCPQPRPNYDNETPDQALLIDAGVVKTIRAFPSMLQTLDEDIQGISFSGGEPLLALDKVIELAGYVTRHNVEIYMWLYTNGRLMTVDTLKRLYSARINEIRFDWTATHYSDYVLDMMKKASKMGFVVTVEIPMYYQGISDDIISKLDDIVDAGVSHLHCAELMITQYNEHKLVIPEKDRYMDPGSNAISPKWSRLESLKIMKYVGENNIPINVNDCSNGSKELQMMKANYLMRGIRND